MHAAHRRQRRAALRRLLQPMLNHGARIEFAGHWPVKAAQRGAYSMRSCARRAESAASRPASSPRLLRIASKAVRNAALVRNSWNIADLHAMRYLKFNTPFTGFPPMSRRLRLIQLLMAVAALYVLPACHAAHSRLCAGAQNPDQIFIALRAAAHKNDAGRALELAAQIPDYPVPSYLDYFTIKPRLFDASGRARLDAPDAPVLAFLKKYAGTAIADRMRNDYLLVLGARRAWRDFEAHYPQFALDDDPQVKCYALIPRAMRGEDIAQKAHALLRIAPKKYGEGCTDLVMTLAQQGQFAPEDV